MLSFASCFPVDVSSTQELTTEVKLFIIMPGRETSLAALQFKKCTCILSLRDSVQHSPCFSSLQTCTYTTTFSLLKMVKTRLRSTMTDPRLSNLCVLSFDRELCSKLDSHEIVSVFATVKPRRIVL